jgi:hypothetical protein
MGTGMHNADVFHNLYSSPNDTTVIILTGEMSKRKTHVLETKTHTEF